MAISRNKGPQDVDWYGRVYTFKFKTGLGNWVDWSFLLDPAIPSPVPLTRYSNFLSLSFHVCKTGMLIAPVLFLLFVKSGRVRLPSFTSTLQPRPDNNSAQHEHLMGRLYYFCFTKEETEAQGSPASLSKVIHAERWSLNLKPSSPAQSSSS